MRDIPRNRTALTLRNRVIHALRDTWWSITAPIAGIATGAAIAVTSDRTDRGAWLFWAALAIASTTAAGAVFIYGLRRWQDLTAIDEITPAEVLRPVTLVLLVAILGIHAPAIIKDSGYDWRAALLTTTVNLAAIPAAGTAYGTRVIALRPAQGKSSPTRVGELLALRGLNERILAALGGLILLMTIQYAARLHLHSSGRPPEYALVFGGFGSLIVALLYVPSWTAIRARAVELRDALFPLTSTSGAAGLLRVLEDREKLAAYLGINRTLAADFQAGLLIAAPLLAGASAVILAK